MLDRFSRTELLLGPRAMQRLKNARVAVFGIGGVGGFTVEALARSGVGALDLIDHDTVSLTNLNRQIIATEETIGRYKVDVAAERVHSINPDCVVRTYRTFYLPDTAEDWLDEFSVFSIYQVLPEIIELWGLNVQTQSVSKKNGPQPSGN